MTENGVIVDKTIEWCTPKVTVPKISGNIRIRVCVDLLFLYENIEREFFPMAAVDYTLSQFNNAVFV